MKALTVNNASILENYHLYILMGLIDQTSVLDSLTFEQMAKVRDTIKLVVLPTDMSLHFNIVG